MSKATESLVALLVSNGLFTQANAEALVEDLDDLTAKRLVDGITESQGRMSKNLPAGEGGLIAGLRDLIAARKIDAEFSLPSAPYELSREDKAKVIEQLDNAIKASNELFADGLRKLLAAKNQERLETLGKWVEELSDEDFPVAMQRIGDQSNEETEKLLSEVRKKLETDRENLNKVAKGHRDIADGDKS